MHFLFSLSVIAHMIYAEGMRLALAASVNPAEYAITGFLTHPQAPLGASRDKCGYILCG